MYFKEKAYYLLIGFFYLIAHFVSAQDQRVADSLTKIYQASNLEGIEMLELLDVLSFNEVNDGQLRLKYAEELISLAKLANNNKYLISGYTQKGNYYMWTGDLEIALETFFTCAELAIKIQDIAIQGTLFMSIADVYSLMSDSSNAESYYNRSIEILRKTNDSIRLASTLLNAGDEYFNTTDYDKALLYFEESSNIFKNINYPIGIAYNLGNIGMVYAEQGKDELAEANINEAIEILPKTGRLLSDFSVFNLYVRYLLKKKRLANGI